MIIPFPVRKDEGSTQLGHLEGVAPWRTAASLRAHREPDVLPGIVSPLEFHAEFLVNSQADAASVTLGNGVVWLSRAGAAPSSGVLSLSLRWSRGYRADGVRPGDALPDDWIVERVEATGIELSHQVLQEGARETKVPTVTIVKPSAAAAGDEFTACLAGDAPECRDSCIRGWVHG